ncbi:MAG: hypothetical protein ACN4GT_07690 [Gammaproteobacteria bacterium]
MSDHKHNPLARKGTNGFSNGNGQHESVQDRREKGLVAADGKDVSGWEAYRRWLTRVQAPEKRRAPLDPGLYTWKGYRNWSDKVRRDWQPEE